MVKFIGRNYGNLEISNSGLAGPFYPVNERLTGMINFQGPKIEVLFARVAFIDVNKKSI